MDSTTHQLAQRILSMLNKREEPSEEFIEILQEEYPKVDYEKTKVYSQNWTAYNNAQQKEKILLMDLLNELLDYIPFPQHNGMGRKPIPIGEKIFYIAMQSYNGKSSRRCIADLEIARKLGYVLKAPHFNSILKCLNDPCVTDYLKHLVHVSGIPLQHVENDFAVDSSGFSTSMFGRWFDDRTESMEKRRKYVKAHLTCGVRTNIITAVQITRGTEHDTHQFQRLITKTSDLYNIKEVSADKAYLSRQNLQHVSNLGAIPFIPFKSNNKRPTHNLGSPMWKKMYRFFTQYPDEFEHHYHKRSNVESTFHAIKRKFGTHLRSKTETGQANEVLAKCLCHNLCVLIQESFEQGIDLDFRKCAEYNIAHDDN